MSEYKEATIEVTEKELVLIKKVIASIHSNTHVTLKVIKKNENSLFFGEETGDYI